MQIEVLKSKIHRASVTQANLNYVGSITIDEDLLDAAGMIEGEKVQVLDIDNGMSERCGGPQGSGRRQGDNRLLCAHGFRGREKFPSAGRFPRHCDQPPVEEIESHGRFSLRLGRRSVYCRIGRLRSSGHSWPCGELCGAVGSIGSLLFGHVVAVSGRVVSHYGSGDGSRLLFAGGHDATFRWFEVCDVGRSARNGRGIFRISAIGDNNMSVPRSVYRRNMDRPQRRSAGLSGCDGCLSGIRIRNGGKADCMRVDALLYDSRNGDLEINNIIYRTL